MGLFGSQRQRALAQFNNPRNVGSDGLALADNLRPDAPVAMPPGYMGGRGIGDGRIEMQMGFPPIGGPATIGNPTPMTVPPRAPSPSLFQTPNVDGSPMTFEGVKPAKPQGKGGFFRKNGPWVDVLGAIGDGLSGNPLYHNAKMQRLQMDREDAKLLQQRNWQVEDRNWKASQPDYFTSGRDRVKLNPLTGETQVVYDGPEDFDEYATAMGFEPGSDEYESAVLDFVLRGHGPTALGIDKQLDDYRTDNDKGYDDYRTRNRLKVRGTPSYRDKNPLPPRSTRKRSAPPVIATNPKTGEQLVLDERGNWTPLK